MSWFAWKQKGPSPVWVMALLGSSLGGGSALHHPHGFSVGSGRLPIVRSRVRVGIAAAETYRLRPVAGAVVDVMCGARLIAVPLQEHIGCPKVNLQ